MAAQSNLHIKYLFFLSPRIIKTNKWAFPAFHLQKSSKASWAGGIGSFACFKEIQAFGLERL